jgi:hypothetical protein
MRAQIAYIFALIFVCAAAVGAAETRLTEEAFSYAVPEGFKVMTVPGLKYKVAAGPAKDGFAVNLNVVDESFNGTIEQYADGNERALAKFPAFRKVSRTAFKTNSGAAGVKMVYGNTQNGTQLHQVMYLLGGKGSTKYVLTGSSLAADGKKYDADFDASAKSFTLR